MARAVPPRAAFNVDRVTEGAVYITDLDGRVSITNDAEAVVSSLYHTYGDKRIFYVDTNGDRDELAHDRGVFTGFKPGWVEL